MDGLDDSAAQSGPVNVPVSSELAGDDVGSGVNRALEESLSTLPCAGASSGLGGEPSGSGRPDARREVFATKRSCSSIAVECRPTPGGMPFEDKEAEVVNSSVGDSRAAEHSAVSSNGSAYQAEGPSGDRTKKSSRTSLTMNSACTPDTARLSASQNPDPSAGRDCSRTGLVGSQQSSVQSEQKCPASAEVSTVPTTSRATPGGGLPVGAAGSLTEEIVEGNQQQPAPSQNAEVQTTDESKNSSHLPLGSPVERVTATSADSESSATAPRQEHAASCFSDKCERGETVDVSPSASIPCATSNGDSASEETLTATSAHFSPHEAGCQAAGATGRTHAPILRAGRNGLDMAASGGAIPSMTAGRSISDAMSVCPVGRDEAKATEQGVDQIRPRHAATPAVNAIGTLASATVGREGTTSHSMIGPSASPSSGRVGRDAADGASVPAVPQTPEEPASSDTSANGLVTPLTTVAVARTPLRVLSAASRLPSAHVESSFNVIAPGTHVSREEHAGSGVTVPGWEGGEPPANGCAMSSSAGHVTSLGCVEGHTGLADLHAETHCSEGTADHDSLGDTADVALAALSYANAVAEERHIDDPTRSTTSRVGDSGEPVGSVSNGTGGGSSVPSAGVALASANGTTDDFATSRRRSHESDEIVTSSATTAVASGSAQSASRARPTCGAASPVKASSESASGSASGKARGDGGPDCLARAGRGQKGARSKSDPHDDLMHAMCMICLEKLSDAGEGGEAKLLGLLDSCSHRYCYTCILEWSKITNKCPQCKARFHTIKAVKELRRKNERYRGVAVRVENRDQVYSFVDVRDVVVLDPGVACHIGCLVRRGVDALQQGWEFSVQCEQCSKWYHGLCVGFRQEWQVPDLWFCRPCRGEAYQIVLDPEAITEPAAIVNRGRASPGGSRGGNRGAGGGVTSEGPIVPTSVSAQGESAEVESGQVQGPQQGNGVNSVPELGRADVDARREPVSSASTSDAGVAAVDVAPTQQTPVSAATSTPRAPVESPPLSLLSRGTALGGSHTPNESPATSSSNGPPLERSGTSLAGGQQRHTTSSPPSTVERTSNPSDAQQQARATPSPSNASPRPLLPGGVNPAPPVPPPATVPPPRGRGRPRGSRNKTTTSRPPQAPRQTSARAMPSTATAGAAGTPPTAALSPRGAAPPARPRGRPRGSKNKPKVQPPAPPAAAPPATALPATAPAAAAPRAAAPPAPPVSAPQLESRSMLPPSTELAVPPPREEQQQRHQEDQIEDVKGTLVEDVLPQPPDPPSPSLLRSLDAGSVTDLCEICGFDTEPDNLIVYCESCNMGVHQTCYGISEIPTKEWYCSPCSAGVHPSTLACRFCPVKGGAMKRCTDDSWGHILCAFWIPECCFIDPQKMEPIGSINRRGQAGGVATFLPHFRSRKCYVCGTSAGSAIRCHTASCKFHLHPMCGSRAGSVYMEIETTMKRGADGTEHESVSLVAKCPRHNKSKATSGRPHKGRPPVASATDPLSVLGKTLEITDPEQGDAVALAGKVTWYNPDRSRYCIVTARHLGDGDDHTGSAEPKEACSHWITVDKLVEAGAMGVLKGGKKVLLEALPASEETETQVDAQSAFRESSLEDEEGGAVKEEAGRESVVSSAEDLSEKKDTVVSLEQTVSEEENVGAAVAGKRCRADAPVEPTGSPEVSAAKRTARADVGLAQARMSLGIDSQSSQCVPEALASPTSLGDSSTSFTEYRAGSENSIEGFEHSAGKRERSVLARCPVQQQDRLLPSVHIPEKADTSARYPIRGRLRRQTQPAFDEPRVLQKTPSVKRQRLAGEADRSLTITADAGSDSSSGTEQAHAGESTVTSADVHSGTSDRVPNHQNWRSPPCAEASIPRVEVRGPHERGSAYRLEPGWPDGMQFLGQVPVMRVRAVRVRSDGDAMYFATAYKDAKSLIGHKRASSRFSFHFEGLEKPGFEIRSNHVRHQNTFGKSIDGHIDLYSEAGAEQSALEREDSTHEDPTKAGARRGEALRVSRTGALQPQNQEAEDGGKTAEGGRLPDSGVEGEIDALSEGQDGTVPSGPREGKSTGAEDANRGLANGVQGDQEAAMGGGVPAQAAARNAGNPASVAINDKNAADVEEMEISSDDASYCGFEGGEAASSCISDDEASDADTHVASDRHREDTAGHSNHGTNASVTVLSEERSVLPQTSPFGAIEQEANAEMHSAAEGGQTSHVKSSVESLSEDGNEIPPSEKEPETAPVQSLPPRETEAVLSLRSIVRKQLQGVLRSASKGKESTAAREDFNDVIVEIADDAEDILFQLLYKDSTGGREYKAKYKQLMLALGNVRNDRLVASVLAGSTTPADLATKDAVGLLNSLSSSLNCLAMPLAGRHRQGSQPYSPAGSSAGNSQKGKGKRLGKMQLL